MGKPFRCQHRKRPAESIGGCEQTQGSEPSQYLEEKKTKVIPLVAASERGTAQTGRCTARPKLEIRSSKFEARQSLVLRVSIFEFRFSEFDAVCSARGCRACVGLEPSSYQSGG